MTALLEASTAATAEVVEDKRDHIGGTDIAPVLGASKWQSAFDVWARLKGLAPPKEDNERFEMGRLMEPIVLEKYARKMCVTVERPPMLVHPRFPWLGGHLDGLAVEASRLVDAKTIERGRPGDNEWSAPEEQVVRIPDDYFWQLMGYSALVPERQFLDIAAQFGFSRFEVYTIPADPELVARMLERLHEWWETHVVGNVPPAIEGSEAGKAVLKRLFPVERSEEIVPCDEKQDELLYALKDAQARFDEAEKARDDLRAQLAMIIGDRKGLKGPWGKATWTKNKDTYRSVTDYEGVLIDCAHVYGFQVPAEFIVKRTRNELVREGPRVLRVTWAKEK